MSDHDIYRALARTALLIELDIFGPGADHRLIIDGLRATTARIIADRANLGSPAGQTALVTLYAQLAMLGLQIDLDVPATGLLTSQPPLRSGDLSTSLLDYSADLLPGGSARPSATPDVTFALGDTPGPASAVRVSGAGWTAAVSRSRPGTLAAAPARPGRWQRRPRPPRRACAPPCPASLSTWSTPFLLTCGGGCGPAGRFSWTSADTR